MARGLNPAHTHLARSSCAISPSPTNSSSATLLFSAISQKIKTEKWGSLNWRFRFLYPKFKLKWIQDLLTPFLLSKFVGNVVGEGGVVRKWD